MGFNLAKKLENVFLTNAGIATTVPKAEKGKIPDLAKGLATVIDDYIKSLELNVTNLDAVVQLDELVIKKALTINPTSLLNLTYIPIILGVPGAPVPVVVTGPVETMPHQKLTRNDFTVKGRAYLGKTAKEQVKLTDQKYDRSAQRNLRHATVSLNPDTRNV
jgi:hypothetical protein